MDTVLVPPFGTILLTRAIGAPVTDVWHALTDPAHFARWWGMHGCTTPHCALDVRPGGTCHVVMRSPDGRTHVLHGRFTEVDVHERMVLRALPGAPPWRCSLELAADERMTTVTVRCSVAGRGTFPLESTADWGQGLDRLEELVLKGCVVNE